MAERRFNEKELAAILRKAAAAQAEGTVQSADTTGFTQAEIERLATEVGIDPKHIAGAVEALGTESEHSAPNRGSSRMRKVIERTYDGTLDDQAWEEVVAELRLVFGGAGTASEVGTSREWAGGSEFASAHLSATPRNGKTRIRLTINQDTPVVLGCLATLMGSMFGSMAVGIPMGKAGVAGPLVLAAVLGVILTVAVVANLVVGNVKRKNVMKGEELMGRIKGLIPKDNLSHLANPISTTEAEPQTQSDNT